MADQPILFSAPMVRALLAGTKTQTRRAIKSIDGHRSITEFGPSDTPGYDWHFRDKGLRWCDVWHDNLIARLRYNPGDRLWVKETWADEHPLAVQEGRYSQPGQAGIPGPPPVTYRTIYRADGEPLQVWRNADHSHPYFTLAGPADEHAALYPTVYSNFTAKDGKQIHWDNPRYMPRWASRITLTVTDVRVQRLHDITDADAIAEGIGKSSHGNGDQWLQYPEGSSASGWTKPVDSYRSLWEQINGAGAWAANPWVAAYTFAVALGNIDALGGVNG